MKYYSLDYKEIFSLLESREEGLTSDVASNRLKKYGKNKIVESKKQSKLSKFLSNFKDLMIIILIISAIVSFIISLINKESFTDSIIIILIVILNAILGFIQEQKADKAIDSLKKMQVTKVKVKRDNNIVIINSENVVKGDILVLEAGDTVVADARIIKSISLKTDESSLTGESIPIEKDTKQLDKNTPLAKRTNMIYTGTNIVYGKCQAIVVETGMDTEFGKIAKSLDNEKKEITPLQKKINGISKVLSMIIFVIIIIMFIVGLIKGMDLLEIFMLSISLAVAAIPEGLPTVITITLSLGMSELAKRNAIVRKMSSVETLGSTEIICSDKTGTITQNKMKVREVYFDNKITNIKDLNKNNLLFKSMILNNDVVKTNDSYIGDPTEIALYECLEDCLDINDIRNNNKRIDELPFDSNRKMMSTINENTNNITLYTKGSFDAVIEKCSYIFENNKVINLTKEMKNKLKNIEKSESNKAYRVLAYAYKKLDNNYILDFNIENNLIFIGMTSMIDPPRSDVKEAILTCKKAGIKPVMITGDSLLTAVSIAREVGILENNNEAITGSQIDNMSYDELKKQVNNYSVYARVSPMNKLSIVNAIKDNNKIVAMTGDGVNDAPSVKKADIGIGMGITGTEVTKNVADIILADDSFKTIVSAVREGRKIFDNIRNVLVYLLTGNITEVLVVFIGMLFGIEIFLPIQLLYINLKTDGIPAIALSFEKENKFIMNRKVRKKDSSFFTPFLISKITFSSILKTLAILFIYFINLRSYGIEIASSTAFLTLILLEMIYSYSCKNLTTSILDENIFNNSYLNKSIIGLSIIQLLIFITPLKNIFNIVSLNLFQILYCFLIVILIFLIDELSKKLISKLFRD